MNKFFVLLIAILMTAVGAEAQHRHRGGNARVVNRTTVVKAPGRRAHVVKTTRIRRYPRAHVRVVHKRVFRPVPVLPVGHRVIVFRNRDYRFHNGLFYRPFRNAFVVMPPPIGIRINVLPPNPRPIVIAGAPAFYAGGAYYRQIDNEYEVVEPEEGTVVPDLPEEGVEEILMDGNTLYEFDDVLYQKVEGEAGVHYEVKGKMEDDGKPSPEDEDKQ